MPAIEFVHCALLYLEVSKNLNRGRAGRLFSAVSWFGARPVAAVKDVMVQQDSVFATTLLREGDAPARHQSQSGF
jgi:hypothetical protein